MSERAQQEPPEDDAREAPEDVEGVDLDPGDGKKSIEVDTNERLARKDEKPDFDTIPDEELEQERQQRLDPENRPDNVEVDNSARDFDPETGLFEDSDVEPPDGAPFKTEGAEG